MLAHELGHFALDAGARLANVIRHINYWFADIALWREVYALSLTSEARGLRFIVMAFAATCVRAVGTILWVLMNVGTALSCLLTLQMEYDADGYSARLVGAEPTAHALRRILEVAAAHELALDVLSRSVAARRLPDDLPEFVRRIDERMPEEFRDAIE